MNRLFALVFVPAALAQSYYGCYTEGKGVRALTGGATYDFENMTAIECGTYCTSHSFGLWGIEYSGECYCGNTLSAGSLKTFESLCNIPCPGNATTICGGNGHLSLYGASAVAPVETDVAHPAVTAPSYLGCFTEGNGTRALAGDAVVEVTLMTLEACGNFCLGRGYLIYGAEYGGECYCGSARDPSSLPALEADCSMPCAGNALEVCGGPNRLSVYEWE